VRRNWRGSVDSARWVSRRQRRHHIDKFEHDPIVPLSGTAGLQFGLQFTSVHHCPTRTDRARWSRLNRSERPRPELLMRLGSARWRGVNGSSC
jgi:hypothetical protein